MAPFLRRLAAVAASAVLATGGVACTSSGSDSAGSASSRDEGPAAGSADGGAAERGSLDGVAADTASLDTATAVAPEVISTGKVSLRADDVAQARLAVQDVVDQHAGQVAQEETATDEAGEVVRSRLVLRVPTADFDAAMADLEGVADLVTSSASTEDVTAEVLDVDIRVRVQRRSIRRIELLLDRAQSIRDIVAIEAQLSRRQAALASLEQRQDLLADRTALATITVSLQRTPEPSGTAQGEDAGFLAGLSAGWDGLVAAAVAAATVAGALLPFAVVGLLLGVPAWLLARRLRRRPGRVVTGSEG